MNRLTAERRAAVIQALSEGNSVRATCRLTGTAKGTVLRLLVELGDACLRFHDATVRNVQARRVQCDEIWSFIGAKDKNVRDENRAIHGDLWTWVAIDADTKLVISWEVGNRSFLPASALMRDLASRVTTRLQITTDGHKPYLNAVEEAFGWNGADYATVDKIYGLDDGTRTPHQTAKVVGTRKTWVMGNPREADVSTSYVERHNLTVRMGCRRFTRLTNGYSKKAANHVAAVALQFVYYNFCRVHHTLTRRAGGIHTSPAMAAGLTDRLWTAGDVVALLDRPPLRLAS